MGNVCRRKDKQRWGQIQFSTIIGMVAMERDDRSEISMQKNKDWGWKVTRLRIFGGTELGRNEKEEDGTGKDYGMLGEEALGLQRKSGLFGGHRTRTE